jgi:hypothetical protein
MDNKLKPVEAQQIPPWVRHFLVHVVKRCASTVVQWCDQMQEASRESYQIESISSNGRLNR